MKRILNILLISLLFAVPVAAETVTLRSGKVITGTILIQNEEVVIIRDANGARHQYPAAEVLSVSSTDSSASEQIPTEQLINADVAERKSTVTVEVAGGALDAAKGEWGAFAAADLLITSKKIAGHEIMLGGAVGYLGTFIAGNAYNFLPISLVLRAPLLQGKHAPIVGFNIGYGIGLSKQYKGGLTTGIDLGYRCQLKQSTSFYIGANARFQQASLPVTDTIIDAKNDEPHTYANNAGRNMIALGLKIGLSF